MPGSQKAACRSSTTWSLGQATPRRKTPGSLHRPSNTFGGLSAPSIKSFRRSWQRPPPQSIPLYQWPSQQLSQKSSQAPPTNKSEANQPRPLPLTNALKRADLSIFISFLTLSLPKKKNYSPHVTTKGPHPVQFNSKFLEVFQLRLSYTYSYAKSYIHLLPCWSLRPRGEAIVMTWPCDPVTWHSTQIYSSIFTKYTNSTHLVKRHHP